MAKRWRPTPMERKCLEHLDAPDSWKILRAATPAQTDVLPWKPFRRIFGFNFVLFGPIFLALFFGLELAASATMPEVLADLPYGLAIAATLAAVMSAYATRLYRKSWNDRARAFGLR